MDSLQVGSDFRLAAHSSPLVRFLLMDDKGEKFGGLKLILCIYVCHVESRWDMYLEIFLYHLALIIYHVWMMDVWTS